MKVSEFAKHVAIVEGLKKPVSIAQIKEILRIINDMMDGAFYREIRRM